MPISMELWEDDCSNVERGQTLRFNHINCPAGQDTKRRLYLTRPASTPGVVLAFCHNCQESGVIRDGVVRYRDYAPEAPVNKTVEFKVPVGMEFDPDNWPNEATTWRIQKNLTKKMCKASGIRYDHNSHRIYLPMYDKLMSTGSYSNDSNLLGYQLRQIDGTGPKYFTALKDQDTKPYTQIGAQDEVCFLVEDLASGLVLAEHLFNGKGNVVVNYGIKITPEILALHTGADNNVVWLDNDSDHVIKRATEIARTWGLISGKVCYVEDIHCDPKNVCDDDMEGILTGWAAL